MPLQINIQSPAGTTEALRFDADSVIVGRALDADVHLDDPNRLVSKQHAEIRRTPDGYRLLDLGSKNFTYLDEVQLEPDRPYPLSDGSTVVVGEFTLTVHVLTAPSRPAPQSLEETVFAADFQNPFEAPVANLVDALDAVVQAYDREAPGRRDDALLDACRSGDLARVPGGHEAVQQLLSTLRLPATSPESSSSTYGARPVPPLDTPPRSTTEPRSPTEPPVASPSANAPSAPPPDAAGSDPDSPNRGVPDEPVPSPNSPYASPSEETDDPTPFIPPEALPHVPPFSHPDSDSSPSSDDPPASVDDAMMAIVAAVSRLITLPWQFRHEFIGQTILQAPETAFLYGSPDSLRESLLSPRLDPAERGRRVGDLRRAAHAVGIHQVAMLDGYKASVTTGADELLHTLDPDALAEEVRAESALYRFVPVLAASAVLDRLGERHADLRRGAWSVAEHRVFRPSFIKAYLARMTAADRPGTPPNTYPTN